MSNTKQASLREQQPVYVLKSNSLINRNTLVILTTRVLLQNTRVCIVEINQSNSTLFNILTQNNNINNNINNNPNNNTNFTDLSYNNQNPIIHMQTISSYNINYNNSKIYIQYPPNPITPRARSPQTPTATTSKHLNNTRNTYNISNYGYNTRGRGRSKNIRNNRGRNPNNYGRYNYKLQSQSCQSTTANNNNTIMNQNTINTTTTNSQLSGFIPWPGPQ